MTVKIPRPDLAMVGLCALALIGIVVCAVLHIAAPPVLDFVATTSLGGGAGIATQQYVASKAASSSSSSQAPSPAPAPTAPAPLVGATTDPAATGVFRAATHAP